MGPRWTAPIEPSSGAVSAPEDGSIGAVHRGPMFDQEGVHEIYRAWNRVLAAYDGDQRAVVGAWVEPLERLARYVRPGEMHQAFNFSFLTTRWDAPALHWVVTAALETRGDV